MKGVIIFVSGLILAFGCLWGCCYVLNLYPENAWQRFPTVLTSVYLGIAGVLLAAFGFTEMTIGK
jgi:hypothetical protein